MRTPRNGQWVKFSTSMELPEEAFRSPDGSLVGIYQRAGNDPFGNYQEARIVPVGPQGQNLRLPNVEKPDQPLLVFVPMSRIVGMAPVVSSNEIPEKRRTPGWEPRGAVKKR